MDQMREAQRALETPLFSGRPGDIEVSFESPAVRGLWLVIHLRSAADRAVAFGDLAKTWVTPSMNWRCVANTESLPRRLLRVAVAVSSARAAAGAESR